jgi:hypothetical protein
MQIGPNLLRIGGMPAPSATRCGPKNVVNFLQLPEIP